MYKRDRTSNELSYISSDSIIIIKTEYTKYVSLCGLENPRNAPLTFVETIAYKFKRLGRAVLRNI